MRKFTLVLAALTIGGLLADPAFDTVADAQSATSSYGGNLLINPWMEIDQLNEGAATTVTSTAAATFTYGGGGSVAAFTLGTTDGWGMTDATPAASNTLTMQNPAIAPNGSVDDMKITIGTGSATRTDGILITAEQRIEPFRIAPLQYGTANAQPSYLSFCVKASIAGNYSFYIAGGTAARTSDIGAGTSGSAYFHQFNIPTAAQFSCYQFTIPGDTGGTWLATTNTVDATHGATLGFVLDLFGSTGSKQFGVPGTGTTRVDGVWQNNTNTGTLTQVIGVNTTNVTMGTTSGATFELVGVRWALDANPLQHQPELELLQAQRYRNKSSAVGIGGLAGVAPRQSVGVAGAFAEITPTVAAYSLTHYWAFPTPMRASPTIITFNPSAANANWRDITGAADFTVVVDTGTSKSLMGVNIGTGSISATVAHACAIHAFADANL